MNDILRPNEFLFINSMLSSPNGSYILSLRQDSNLVLYERVEHEDDSTYLEPIWATDTVDQDAFYAMMQADGNFVLRNLEGDILWETGTDKAGSFLQLRDDGELVVNDATAVWEAETEDVDEEALDDDDMEIDADDAAEEFLTSASALDFAG